MDVAMIAHYLDESVGHGMARYAHRLIAALRAQGVGIHTVSSPPVFTGPAKSALDYFLYLPLRSLLLLPRADIVHLVVPQASIPIGLLRRIHGKKVVTTVYDLQPILFREGSSGFRSVAGALKRSCTDSDLLLAISSQTKRDIMDTFGIPAEKIVVTPLAADEKFRPLPKGKRQEFTIGYVGGFAANKDVQFLIRSYAIFEKMAKGRTRLVLYGKGVLHGECVELAGKLGIKRISFMGFAPEEDLPEIYNSFDVFVFPSLIEGFGLPIIEAQRCGIPAIVRKEARIPAEVTEFCPKAADEEDLARLLEGIRSGGFSFSPEHKRHLAQFTWASCARKTIEAYKRALSG